MGEAIAGRPGTGGPVRFTEKSWLKVLFADLL
jgi:hypothetical protein